MPAPPPLTLILLRHAKAVPHSRSDDAARPLADQGRADAARIGVYLREHGLVPDVALVSSAVRTVQTFEIAAASAQLSVPARLEPSLYNATAGQLRDFLRLIDPSVGRLMIVGHNPGIMDAALLLARDGDLDDLQRLRNRFPPGALAVLTFDTTDWLDARATGGRLELLLLPEDLVAPH